MPKNCDVVSVVDMGVKPMPTGFFGQDTIKGESYFFPQNFRPGKSYQLGFYVFNAGRQPGKIHVTISNNKGDFAKVTGGIECKKCEDHIFPVPFIQSPEYNYTDQVEFTITVGLYVDATHCVLTHQKKLYVNGTGEIRLDEQPDTYNYTNGVNPYSCVFPMISLERVWKVGEPEAVPAEINIPSLGDPNKFTTLWWDMVNIGDTGKICHAIADTETGQYVGEGKCWDSIKCGYEFFPGINSILDKSYEGGNIFSLTGGEHSYNCGVWFAAKGLKLVKS